MIIKESPYTAAITGGGFLFTETNALLPLLQSADREALLKDEKLNNRLLKINAETSRNRAIAEIARRYDAMPASFWEDYKNMNEADQQIALFFVILKTYKICFDFHINVTMRKWNSISKSLVYDDIEMEFNEVSARDEFVDSWSDKTKQKVASAYLTVLRKVGILDKDDNLHPLSVFYNFFIYQYPADKEYDIRRQIQEFKENLIRPVSYVDVLCLNLFEEFCNFLDQKKFLKHPSMLKYQLEKEQADPSKAQNTQDTLTRNAHSPEFVQFLHQRILDHVNIEDKYRRPYVFFYGVGSMFPYLRVNELLALYEDYNDTSRYKIIVFYPGHRENNSFRLFGTLPDNHTYRATLLINE